MRERERERERDKHNLYIIASSQVSLAARQGMRAEGLICMFTYNAVYPTNLNNHIILNDCNNAPVSAAPLVWICS